MRGARLAHSPHAIREPHPLLDVAHGLARDPSRGMLRHRPRLSSTNSGSAPHLLPRARGWAPASAPSPRTAPACSRYSPSLPAALLADLVDDLRRVERPMQVVDVAHLRRPGVGPPHPLGVGHRRTQLRPDLFRRLQQPDRVPQGLGHLRLPIETHDAPRRCQERGGLRKVRLIRRETRVPPARDLARQLQMLDLVFAHRDDVGSVQENVCGLQHRIVEQPGGNALLALRLVLELGLAFELAKGRDRVENPRQLGMFRHR